MNNRNADNMEIVHEVVILEKEVQQEWRRMLQEMPSMPAVDQDQGSNTSPAYSWYMYKHRSAFMPPRKACEQPTPIAQLEKATSDEYASQLVLETNEWEQNTSHFVASLLKEKGNVVYHPRSVIHAGTYIPSLTVYGPAPLSDLLGAAVGDLRYNSYFESIHKQDFEYIHKQTRKKQRARRGVITSISDGGGADVSVLWDGGHRESGICCGKNITFALIYN